MIKMNKDQWIQKAKALLFDCSFCIDSDAIRQEIEDLLKAGGGYNAEIETSESPLKWRKE